MQEVEELQAQLAPLKEQLASYQDLPPVSRVAIIYTHVYSTVYDVRLSKINFVLAEYRVRVGVRNIRQMLITIPQYVMIWLQT